MTKLIGNRYEIIEELGTGGMGTVYRGVDRQSGQPVAVKALKEEVIRDDPVLLVRFEREGEALRHLNHPNIVKMLANLYENDTHYLVMEYVGGGSLVELMEKWPTLPIKQILRIGMGIADALAHTHALNIIHRDIKPANILLTEGGTPRLTDFGVAHTDNSNLTQTGLLMGTLAYLSPEAFRNQEVDQRSDIWSFGVTLFELLTGYRPFHGDNFAAVMQSVIADPIPDLEKLRKDAPVELVDLIYRMLEKNPETRIQDVRRVGTELETTLHSLPATSPRLRVVAHMVMQGGPADARFAQPATLAVGHHNLPHHHTAFVGRERELRDLSLEDKHLVTIIAPDGGGKTRLALQLAESQLEQMPAYWIPLGSISDSILLAVAIGNAIGYTLDSDDPQAQLLNYLRHKKMLLVLDDFQHLRDARPFVDSILHTAKQLRFVVTSTAPLGVSDEAVFTLKGLPYRRWKKPRTAMEYASTQLFVQTVRQHNPMWELTSSDLPHLHKICRLLDGMPLGLKLAAGCVVDMSLQEIAEGIDRKVEFLAADMPELPVEQLRLRAVCDLAVDLLEEAARQATICLSVFESGFMRDAAQEVTTTQLQTLYNLVQRQIIERNNLGRFAMHPVVRRFLMDALNEHADKAYKSWASHCSHYADYVRKRKYDLRGHRQIKALLDIRSELPNIRAAWQWALNHNQSAAMRKMVDPLGIFYCLEHRYVEALHLFGDQVPEQIKENFLCQRGACLTGIQKYEDARPLLEASLDMAVARGQHADIARCLYLLGQEDTQRTAHLLTEALHHARKADDKFLTVRLLNRLSQQPTVEGREQLSTESLALALEIGDRFGEVEAWDNLATLALQKGDFLTAEDSLQAMLIFYRQIGDRTQEARVLLRAGHTNLLRGELQAARQHLHNSIETSQAVGDDQTLGTARVMLGLLASMQGQYAEAEQLGVASLKETPEHEPTALFAHLGVGHTLCALGRYTEAPRHLTAALRLTQSSAYQLLVLIDYAWIYSHNSEVERAAELLGLSLHHPGRLKWIGQDPSIKRLREQLADELNDDVYDRATKRGQSLDLNQVVSDILEQ